jgi:HAD superfamily hydrolase (TIGR01549 family)
VATLGELVARAEALILDFDGPVCSVFAGYPPEQVAAEMIEQALKTTDDVPEHVRAETDPMGVLSWSGTTGDTRLVEALDSILSRAEYEAVLSAETTAGIEDVVRQAMASGMKVAIASNNSAAAISRFLSNHPDLDHVKVCIGRPIGHPEQMKPDPYVLLSALDQLGCSAGRAAFVGDSLSDVVAARSAEVPVIAYANKEPKVRVFREAEPDALIVTMTELADALCPR